MEHMGYIYNILIYLIQDDDVSMWSVTPHDDSHNSPRYATVNGRCGGFGRRWGVSEGAASWCSAWHSWWLYRLWRTLIIWHEYYYNIYIFYIYIITIYKMMFQNLMNHLRILNIGEFFSSWFRSVSFHHLGPPCRRWEDNGCLSLFGDGSISINHYYKTICVSCDLNFGTFRQFIMRYHELSCLLQTNNQDRIYTSLHILNVSKC